MAHLVRFYHNRKLWRIGIGAIFSALFILLSRSSSAAVEIQTFEAELTEDFEVALKWITGVETDIIGYKVFRYDGNIVEPIYAYTLYEAGDIEFYDEFDFSGRDPDVPDILPTQGNEFNSTYILADLDYADLREYTYFLHEVLVDQSTQEVASVKIFVDESILFPDDDDVEIGTPTPASSPTSAAAETPTSTATPDPNETATVAPTASQTPIGVSTGVSQATSTPASNASSTESSVATLTPTPDSSGVTGQDNASVQPTQNSSSTEQESGFLEPPAASAQEITPTASTTDSGQSGANQDDGSSVEIVPVGQDDAGEYPAEGPLTEDEGYVPPITIEESGSTTQEQPTLTTIDENAQPIGQSDSYTPPSAEVASVPEQTGAGETEVNPAVTGRWVLWVSFLGAIVVFMTGLLGSLLLFRQNE